MRLHKFLIVTGLVAGAIACEAKPLPSGAVQNPDWENLLRGLDLDSSPAPASFQPMNSRATTPSPIQFKPEDSKVNPMDPFLAGALGIMPFSSGFYISDTPAKGFVFSAIDVLLALGIYTAKNTRQGDPDNVFTYYLLMGANNILDAYFSAKDASKPRAPVSKVTFRPEGGVSYAMQWTF